MRRRDFLTLLAAAVAACPNAAPAQQRRIPTIGVLVLGNPDPVPFFRALRSGLEDIGYLEGQNIRLEIRNAEGDPGRLSAQLAELLRLKVDAIVPFQTLPATAAKRATNKIPIVMAGAGDPVGTGLIASMARPGGNITGVSAGAAEVAGKSVELIREVVPRARRIAVLADETNPFAKPFVEQIGTAARSVGMEIEPVMSRSGEALEPAFERMVDKRADALIIQGSILRKETLALAARHGLPSLSSNRFGPASGGLLSYAASFDDLYRETAVYIDKILKGASPADLPVTFPTRFHLVINLKTARTLGLDIPPTVLARADEVIE
jgi:putative ABC transport system substrate-binding protein